MKALTPILKIFHFIVIAYAFWIFYSGWEDHTVKIKNIKDQIPSIESQITLEKKNIQRAKEFEASLEDTKKRVQEVQNQFLQVQRQLPIDNNDTEILGTLSDEIKNINIDSKQLRPGKEELRGFFYAKDYLVEASGTWLQFLVFFENLAKEDRIYNIKKLFLKRSETKNRGRFQKVEVDATLEAYRYNKEYTDTLKEEAKKEVEAKSAKRKRK